jgi:dTDP-4-amino-4,6-dideoxygalactose transaminase
MIRLASPEIDFNEIEAIKSVLESGYLVQGEYVEAFENKISQFLNIKHAIAVSSGTAALHLALLALGIGPNDEVIVPDFTFPATANVVEIVGANNVLVDIKLDDFCIDVSQIEKKITSKTKAIMPVHEFGHSADMDKIMQLASKYNLKVIEDAACALGSEYNGKKIGTIGDIACFSFHPRKSITTGEGGIVVTNNDDIARQIRLLRNHGIDWDSGVTQFMVPGYNYRLTNLQGAIGEKQMDKFNSMLNRKKELVKVYDEAFSNYPGIRVPREINNCSHTYQTYYLLLDESMNRNKIIKHMKDFGIETNFGAYSVHSQPFYLQKYKLDSNEFKNSLYAHNYGVALPLHSKLQEKDLIYVSDKLKDAINQSA